MRTVKVLTKESFKKDEEKKESLAEFYTKRIERLKKQLELSLSPMQRNLIEREIKMEEEHLESHRTVYENVFGF